MPKITTHGGPSHADDVPAPTDPDLQPATVVVDEHGDDAAAVADAPKPGPKARSKAGA